MSLGYIATRTDIGKKNVHTGWVTKAARPATKFSREVEGREFYGTAVGGSKFATLKRNLRLKRARRVGPVPARQDKERKGKNGREERPRIFVRKHQGYRPTSSPLYTSRQDKTNAKGSVRQQSTILSSRKQQTRKRALDRQRRFFVCSTCHVSKERGYERIDKRVYVEPASLRDSCCVLITQSLAKRSSKQQTTSIPNT